MGELAELFQWLPASEAAELAADEPLRSRVGEEIADVFIYLLQLANSVGIDLVPAATEKLNAARRRFPAAEIYGVAPSKS
jgi:NTP pyrophosphatase (non-canonical NTP hydrolase)